MTELTSDGQLRGPSFLRLMGIRLPTDDRRPGPASRCRSAGAPVVVIPPISIPSITLGEMRLLPAATIYTLRNVPTSSRYRLSIDTEECVAEHEARLASTRNGSKASLISHKPSVKALKSPAPSPEANVQHATRAFVSKAQPVAPSVIGDDTPAVLHRSVAEDIITATFYVNKGLETQTSHEDPALIIDKLPTESSEISALAAPTRAKPVRRTSRKAIPAVDERGASVFTSQSEGNMLAANKQKWKPDILVSEALHETAVLFPRSSSRKVRPRSKIDGIKAASDKALPTSPGGTTRCTSAARGDTTAPMSLAGKCPASHHVANADISAVLEDTLLAETARGGTESRGYSYYVNRWELTPRLCRLYDKRYQGNIPERIPVEDLLRQIALDLYEVDLWRLQASPAPSASPTLGELENWFKFLWSVSRFEEAHLIMKMTERMLRHYRGSMEEEFAGKRQQATLAGRSMPAPVEDQVMRIVEAHIEHRQYRSCSAYESSPAAKDTKTITCDLGAAVIDDTDPSSTNDKDSLRTIQGVPAPIAAPTPPAKVHTLQTPQTSIVDTRSRHTAAEIRRELDRLKTMASLFAMQLTKEEASYVSQHAARLLKEVVPRYTGRSLTLAAPDDLHPLSCETQNIYAPPPSSADKKILLSPEYFSALMEQRKDASVRLHAARQAYLELSSPQSRNGELDRNVDWKWYKEEEVPRDYRLRYALRREANMKAVIDYVVAHRRLEMYKVSRNILLWEMEYDTVQERRQEDEGSDDSGLDEDLLTPDAIKRALLIQQRNSYITASQVEGADILQRRPNSASQAFEALKAKPKLSRPISVISDALGIVERSPIADRHEERLVGEVAPIYEEDLSVDKRSGPLPRPTMVPLDTDLTTSHENLARYHTWLTDLPPSRASHEATTKKGHFRRRSIEVARDLGPNLAAKVTNAFSRSMDNLLTSLNAKTDTDWENIRNPKSPTFMEALPMARRRSVMNVFHSRKTSYVYKEDFAPVENIAPTTPSVKIAAPSPLGPKPSRARAFSDTEYTVMQIEGVSRPQTAQERNIHLHLEVEAAEKRMYDLLPRREKLKLKMKRAGKRMVYKIQDAADLAMGRR